MREPDGRRRLVPIDLDPPEVRILLELAPGEVDPGDLRARTRAFRQVHLDALRVEVVAGLDSPANDGEIRSSRRRPDREGEVRVQELGLVLAGLEKLPQEPGRVGPGGIPDG